jgi:hypothetical protein
MASQKRCLAFRRGLPTDDNDREVRVLRDLALPSIPSAAE